jgi:hypothetical protein
MSIVNYWPECFIRLVPKPDEDDQVEAEDGYDAELVPML